MVRSPSMVPRGNDQDVYLGPDVSGGGTGQAGRETDAEPTRLEAVIADLLDGQYSNPVRVIAFNTAGGLVAGRLGRCRSRTATVLCGDGARSACLSSGVP